MNRGTGEPIVSVRDLRVRYRGSLHDAVTGVSVDVAPGEVVALVGESGSGKSTTAAALLGLLGKRAEVTASRLEIAGVDMRRASRRAWRETRGGVLARVAQDPLAALNPNRRIGDQLGEAAPATADRREGVRSALRAAGIAEPDEVVARFPHELSGGQRQRALIALALVAEPRMIVADEPTSSVDAMTRRLIVDQLGELVRERGLGLLLITHDLGLATGLSDRTIVMQGGRVVEAGATARLITAPESAITAELVSAARELALPPARDREAQRPSGAPSAVSTLPGSGDLDSAAPRSISGEAGGPRVERGTKRGVETAGATAADPAPLLQLDDVTVRYGSPRAVLEGTSLSVAPGETLGIVGESGAGKTTLVRAALGLAPLSSGSVRFEGTDLASLRREELRLLRRRFQLVQQDPFASLDPRYTVARCIAEPLRAFRVGTRTTQNARVLQLLRLVRLPEELAQRKPRQLSGGQRQRVAIARALALEPDLVYFDEALSALDATVQASLVALLRELQRQRRVGYVFVSHDLGVVARLAHRIAVLRNGRVVESGDAGELLDAPRDPYTRELVDAARTSALSSAPLPDLVHP